MAIKLLVCWICLFSFCNILHSVKAVDCFTCSVDFRGQPFDQNNSCLFPHKDNEKTRCSDASKYCQGVITRINGVFVMLQRTCETECHQLCVEKGFGIETSECRYCCDKRPDCGMAGYKSAAIQMKQNFWSILLIFCVSKFSYLHV